MLRTMQYCRSKTITVEMKCRIQWLELHTFQPLKGRYREISQKMLILPGEMAPAREINGLQSEQFIPNSKFQI